MTYKLLVGGYRPTLGLVSFEPETAKLKTISETPAPKDCSWLEPAGGSSNVVYGLSEDNTGAVFSAKLKDGKVEIGQKRETPAGTAHIHVLKDGSGIAVATYLGGTALFFPTSGDKSLLADSTSPNLHFDFPYKGKDAPNPERQEQSHPHQVTEGEGGKLYVPDLGADKVWIVEREGEELKVTGYLQAPAGAGPRHAVISADGKHLYCLTELHSSVLAWTLDEASEHPLPDFEASIIPPSVPSSHSKYMDSAELILHSKYPRTLFASNRLERQIFDKQPDLPKLPNYPPKGDAVAIFVLSADGKKVESTKHIRTEADGIRAMAASPDGKYVALAGQSGGGVEIWVISGENGDEWKLAAKEESIEGVTTIVWV